MPPRSTFGRSGWDARDSCYSPTGLGSASTLIFGVTLADRRSSPTHAALPFAPTSFIFRLPSRGLDNLTSGWARIAGVCGHYSQSRPLSTTWAHALRRLSEDLQFKLLAIVALAR